MSFHGGLATLTLMAVAGISGCNFEMLTNSKSSTSQPPSQPVDTFRPPNLTFAVQAEAGTCPETVALWELGLAFEGGADHTVVADFAPISRLPVEILQSEEHRIVYGAPLQPDFATCVGSARSDAWSMYAFQFSDGQLRFELDLTNSDGFREIRYADVAVNRPYVYWRAAE